MHAVIFFREMLIDKLQKSFSDGSSYVFTERWVKPNDGPPAPSFRPRFRFFAVCQELDSLVVPTVLERVVAEWGCLSEHVRVT